MRQPENHIEAFFMLLVPFALVLIVLVYFHRKHLLYQEHLGINTGGCPGCNETPAQREQMMAHMPLYVDDSGNRPYQSLRMPQLTVGQIRGEEPYYPPPEPPQLTTEQLLGMMGQLLGGT